MRDLLFSVGILRLDARKRARPTSLAYLFSFIVMFAFGAMIFALWREWQERKQFGVNTSSEAPAATVLRTATPSVAATEPPMSMLPTQAPAYAGILESETTWIPAEAQEAYFEFWQYLTFADGFPEFSEVEQEIAAYTAYGIGRERLLAELKAAWSRGQYWRRTLPSEYLPDVDATKFDDVDSGVLLTFGMILPEGAHTLELVDVNTLSVLEKSVPFARYLEVKMTYGPGQKRWLWVDEAPRPLVESFDE